MILSVLLPQTELLPHCSDVPPLARVVQEDGKLLVQAVLEVRSTTIHTTEMFHHFPDPAVRCVITLQSLLPLLP